MKKLVIVLSLAFSVSSILAQQDTVVLDNVIISANRVDQNDNEVGRSTTVISRQEMEAGNYTTVAEVLSHEAGIFVVGTNQTPGQVNGLFMRGSGTDQTVFMIDGVRITDPSGVNNAIDLMEISLSNIDRIEIVRGGHSVMYGSSAIGGVVNIITRTDEGAGFKADVALTSGTFGTDTYELGTQAHVSYVTETGLYANLDLITSEVSGLDATTDTVTDPATFNNPDKDNYSRLEYQGKLGYNSGSMSVWAGYKLSTQQSDVDRGAYRDDDNYTVDFERSLITYGASYKLTENLDLRLNGGFSNMERSVLNDSSVIDVLGNYDTEYFSGTYTGTLLNNDLVLNWKSLIFDVVAGGGMYRETMSNNTYTYLGSWAYEAEYSLDSLAPEANMYYGFFNASLLPMEQSVIFNRVSLNFGARFTNHSIYGSNLNTQLGITVKIDGENLLYGSATSGFNAPSLYRLYEPTKHWLSGITRGNENLKPEESLTWEVGIKHNSESLSLTASVFNTEILNVVEYVYLWEDTTAFQNLSFLDERGDTYINLSNRTITGFELEASYRLNEQITFSGNVSVLYGKTTFSPDDIDNEHTQGYRVQLFESGRFIESGEESIGLTRRSNTGNFTVTYKPSSVLSIYGGVRYAGPRPDVYYDPSLGPFGALNTQNVEEYVLYDAGFRAQLSGNISANLKINNLLNTEYSEIFGYNTRGRSIYLTLRFSLGKS